MLKKNLLIFSLSLVVATTTISPLNQISGRSLARSGGFEGTENEQNEALGAEHPKFPTL